jgi:hypothetical protein
VTVTNILAVTMHIRTAHVGHLCWKTNVLSCHRCLINTVVEKKLITFICRPLNVPKYKVKFDYSNNCLHFSKRSVPLVTSCTTPTPHFSAASLTTTRKSFITSPAGRVSPFSLRVSLARHQTQRNGTGWNPRPSPLRFHTSGNPMPIPVTMPITVSSPCVYVSKLPFNNMSKLVGTQKCFWVRRQPNIYS